MMDVLVTTVKGYGLVHEGKLVWRRHGINFYGLTWSENDVFWSWNPADVHGSVIESQKHGVIKGLPDIWDVHQILWAQGRLWITDTAHDRIIWWDGGCYGVVNMHPNDKADNLHINSLWEWDGRVSALISGLNADGYVKAINGSQTHRIGPAFYHNFYAENGVLYGCYKEKDNSSGVFRKRLSDGPMDELPFPPGSFARGLARGDGVFLVGCSESLPRDRRFEGGSKIVTVDDDFKIVDAVDLPDTGQIRDVRLPRGDRSHNGLPFP